MGIFTNPWIFKSIVEGQDYFPSVSETADVVRMHSDLVSNFMEIRKHLAAYFKGLPGIKKYRLKLVTVETKEDVEAILKEIVANYKT